MSHFPDEGDQHSDIDQTDKQALSTPTRHARAAAFGGQSLCAAGTDSPLKSLNSIGFVHLVARSDDHLATCCGYGTRYTAAAPISCFLKSQEMIPTSIQLASGIRSR